MTTLALQYEIDEASSSSNETRRTVVLLHGFPDTPAMWAPTARRLCAEGFRVLRVALPGFERNASKETSSVNSITFDEVTDALHDVLRKENALDAALVGHDDVAKKATQSRFGDQASRP